MQPCISQVCSLESPFKTDIEDYAAGHCPAVELWLTKLETYLQTHSIEDAKSLLAEHGVAAPAASLQGGLLTSQGDARQEAWDLFDARIALCQALDVGVLVVACDVPSPLTAADLERMRVSLTDIGSRAGQGGIKAALEFQCRSAVGNNLQTAIALVEEAGSPHLGICLDAFHYYTGPSQPEDLAGLTAENLFHVQLCDVLAVPREFASDSDRILPGDGDIPLTPIVEHLKHINYQGAVSIELMNPQIWRIPALQFGETAITALRTLLGIAEK